ncbi:hypothetical protein PoB_001227300 [Plakobranchus ocellatus]|uniref:Uncharacterized protein n=1 Tax=Plakobranchus ocellatus TaxID=259542 RepID=A0AAV3YTS1_9GAST|nr:hypothetical protein PoB_001227300 [Plakobranchus ocellatus]
MKLTCYIVRRPGGSDSREFHHRVLPVGGTVGGQSEHVHDTNSQVKVNMSIIISFFIYRSRSRESKLPISGCRVFSDHRGPGRAGSGNYPESLAAPVIIPGHRRRPLISPASRDVRLH